MATLDTPSKQKLRRAPKVDRKIHDHSGGIRMRPSLRSLFLLVLASGTLLFGERNVRADEYLAQGYYYGPAYGPPAPPPPQPGYYRSPRYVAPAYYGGRTHDGLYLRFTAGAGFFTASESYQGSRISYSGLGFTASGALGGAIAPNLILYGEILGTTVADAEWSQDGYYQGSSNTDLEMFGFGPGIAYYIQPANMYLSATLAFTKVSFIGNDPYYGGYTQADTDFGVGVSLRVGKEWWVGPRWGVGIAGMAHLASMHDPTWNERVSAAAFSVLLSASFD
jgi:hypothetical protein